ncbi:hypothetical protein [Reyranella massiliensis]|uniref:hypothetical protein n=1 Tax=Reyranella massiliensis TaxID=445220 RepID=UPI0011D2A80B|nr:hypothetical protein [Reyranella massiliensis]
MLVADASIMRAIVQGPATGPASSIVLPTGQSVKTLSRVAAELVGGFLPLAGGTLSGTVKAPNFAIGNELVSDAGTVGFTNVNGPAIQFYGTSVSGSMQLLTGGLARWTLQSAGHLVPNGSFISLGAPASPVASIHASNYKMAGEAAADAGTVGFTNNNGPSLTFWGNSSAGTGALVAAVGSSEIWRTVSSGLELTATAQLMFGGTTSSFPGLRRSGTTIEAVLADASAFGSLGAGAFVAKSGAVWPFDTTGISQTIGVGGTFSLAAGAGLVVLTENTTGQCALFICGGGIVILVAQTATIYAAGTPGSGKIGLEYSGGVYRINNNTGSTYTIGIAGVRVRAAS